MNVAWLNSRKSGFLLHLTALPSVYGIGNLGNCVCDWLDFLKASGMRCWQICPVGPTGFGNSPYSSLSAFAGNPLLLDFESLVSVGLLNSKEILRLTELSTNRVQFNDLEPIVSRLLETVFENFTQNQQDTLSGYGSFIEFKKHESAWLRDYCLYRALKNAG